MNQVAALPDGAPYVMSFVELREWGIVVRMVGLTDGFVRRALDMGIELRDDEGRMYPWRATASGGMVWCLRRRS